MHKILLWLGYPMVKNFEDIFIRLTQLTNVTDTQTDRHCTTASGLCITSRGKNDEPVLYTENWPKSTAVITGVIFTCRCWGRFLALTAAALVYFATKAPLDAYLAL